MCVDMHVHIVIHHCIESPPRPPGSARVTSNTGAVDDNVSLLLLPRASGTSTGADGDSMRSPILQELAILTPDVDAFVDRVEKTVIGATVRVAVDGASTKSATKVAVVTDPEVCAFLYAHTHIHIHIHARESIEISSVFLHALNASITRPNGAAALPQCPSASIRSDNFTFPFANLRPLREASRNVLQLFPRTLLGRL